MTARRRYLVPGAGAVGSALGGMLRLAGADVVLVARGAHLDALRERGLRLDTPSRRLQIDVDAVAHPREISFETRDFVLLCTKSQDTAAALADLAASAPRDLPVACAQNGVANESLAARSFDRVYGLVVFAPMELAAPGRVTLHSEPVLGGLDLGVHPAGADALAADVARDLVAAGFDARVEPRVLRMKYGKLLANLGNALQALAGRAGLESSLNARLRDEALACYRSGGIEFMPLDDLYARYADVRELPVEGAPRGGGSTWQSLARGTGTIETRYLNGEIVSLGERHGVATPYNRALTRLAERAAAERWAPARLTAAELEAAVGAEIEAEIAR